MSVKVLVIPEDPTYNGAILLPLVKRILEACEKPNARVTVLTNPRANGFEHVKALLPGIEDRYRHFDLLLFLVDADGLDRRDMFTRLESEARDKGVKLLCCAAVQEVEIWLLAGHADKLSARWSDVRAEVSLKEVYFQPFLQQHGDSRRPAGGRDLLMDETLANYPGLLARCPELAELAARIRNAVTAQL